MQKISFLVSKTEIELLEEACMYGADADEILENAVKDDGKYRIEVKYEELDDLAGFIANCANHEESERRQKKWDKLYDKLNTYQSLMDKIKTKPKTNKKKQCKLKNYIFDVYFEEVDMDGIINVILRKIQIAESKNLYNFAKVITMAFDFQFDHCFGFYDNFKRYHDSKKAYELFVDIGEEPSNENIRGVKKTQIKQAFKKPGDKMLFLFDYGGGWRFTVKLKEIKNAEKWDLKPVVLESKGEAPMQYPPCEEEFFEKEY